VSTPTKPTSPYGWPVVDQSRRLKLHPNTLHRWIRKGGLAATLIGGRWFVTDEAIDQFFRERTAARLKKSPPVDTRAHDAADRALTEGGW
jgi:hypothetical protein